MSEYLQRATRVLAIFVAVAVFVSAVPSIVGVTSPVADVEAADETIVDVGWLNGEVQNWNPLKIEMIEDYVVCYLMYSSLWYYDEDWGGPVGDLALSWYQDIQTNGSMSTYVNITHDAYFRDSADPSYMGDNLVASDVKYTFELIMANPGYTVRLVPDRHLVRRRDERLPGQDQHDLHEGDSHRRSVDGADPLRDYWDSLSNEFGSLSGADMYGSGPFLYDSELANSWWLFKKAPNYHGAM